MSTTLRLTSTVPLNLSIVALQTAMATKVDTGNLGVINTQVQNVVVGMVAVGQTNDLALQLNSKLTNSPTCSCYDPAVSRAMNNTINTLASAINVSLSCTDSGMVYSPTTRTCKWPSTVVDCGSVITGLDPNAAGACGLTQGSTKQGATCIASCNQGYTYGRSAIFTCGSNGLWNGTLTCPGMGAGGVIDW